MNVWQFLEGIVRNPPLILVAILIAIVAAHVLKLAFEFITKRPQPNSLIITLEIFVVIVLAYVVIHLYSEKLMRSESALNQYEPLMVVCLLIFFTIVSMIVYVFFRIAVQEQDRE
jgi:predicted tellurium resistance membrane protein TerC